MTQSNMPIWASAVRQAHQLCAPVLEAGCVAIDATSGNGHDTLFLAQRVGKTGKVYAFDIQDAAIKATRKRLLESGLSERVSLIQASHAEMLSHIGPRGLGAVSAVMFNLGYLPGADHDVITTAGSTLDAIDSGLALLRPDGVMTIVVYTGHVGGREEADAVETHIVSLDPSRYDARLLRSMNRSGEPPYLIAIRRVA
jgi:SAM-dependent methyltransferase